MKRSIGAKTIVYPAPAFVIGTYDQTGRPNVMTAAWAGICCSTPPCVAISLREATYTYGNIMEHQAFTVNIGEGDPGLVHALRIREGSRDDDVVTRRVYLEDVDFEVSIAHRTTLRRVLVDSEEGVDVVTFVVDADPDASYRRCLLRVARRNRQIALVVRNLADASEHTLTVFQP